MKLILLEEVDSSEKVADDPGGFGMSGRVFHGPLLKVHKGLQVRKVLERTKNGWKIMQYVLSVPIPNEVYPAVFEMIKEHEAKQPEREQQPQ